VRSGSVRSVRLRALEVVRNHRVVQLRFVLDRAGRVTFVLFGPAPGCAVAGRFAVAGRRGANVVRFTGRIHKRLLPPGVYAIAPRVGGGPTSVPGPSAVAVRVDVRGARPVARLPQLNCRVARNSAAAVVVPLLGGIAGVQQFLPAQVPAARSDPGSTSRPAPAPAATAATAGVRLAAQAGGLLSSSVHGWPIITAFGSLVLALLLLSLVAVQLGHGAYRLRGARALEAKAQAHRDELVLVATGLLGLAGILFILTRL
jgi:hypothetical protein